MNNQGSLPSYIRKLFIGIAMMVSYTHYAQTLVPADNAVNVSNDMQFKLTFSSAPILQSAGKICLCALRPLL